MIYISHVNLSTNYYSDLAKLFKITIKGSITAKLAIKQQSLTPTLPGSMDASCTRGQLGVNPNSKKTYMIILHHSGQDV